ncbi:MAG TPA: ABC transporter ATP-binding protein, partial [Chloroflexota bacterium]
MTVQLPSTPVEMPAEPPGGALVEVRDLVVKRDAVTVLEVPSLSVRRGEVLAVIGPNGAGKSTLLSVLAFLLSPAAGEIRFGGRLVSRRDDLVRLRRRMAVVFQEPLLLDTSVRSNVESGLRIRGVDPRQAAVRSTTWMERFGVSALAERQARKLSGGEAQRVSLARAFALEPELLLLDEPFSALDAPTRASLFDDFERVLRESQITTLFVTHDRTEAMRLGDRIAVMLDGKVAQVGPPEEVFSTPADERVASFVGVENLVPGLVVEQRDGLATVEVRGGVAEAVSDIPSGQRVIVCLRPEEVVVAPIPAERAPSSARNKLRGRIERTVQLGSQVR